MLVTVGGGEDVVISRYIKMRLKNKRRVCAGVDACVNCIMVRAFCPKGLDCKSLLITSCVH